ncbi:type I iterative polyketide synthase [Aspergillus viridinutans]|uniref:Type I iterative polyketide synthase n=1 Tax=Aspergillus viridinutans TaxID=75553 RepID=A0A9P3BN60_ASPVI|nr:type I iterative polyketide synthase [Aspergillus viridinutans]GIJ99437.1 type I iterative polyketide synthase [Aspergillus viridinutans]
MARSTATDSLPPLAVVGLSFKFPEDATSSDAFWQMLLEGRCVSTEFPADRMNIDAHYHPDRNRLDSISMRGGHFLKENLAAFDAPFFSMSAAEAEAMDPQQRMVLETVYRALENAGLPMEKVAGSKTSVIAGSFSDDYFLLQTKDPLDMPKYTAVGTSRNMLANRVSWFFDLLGPSVAVDTACSSSLIALDMTCQSIWSGDAAMGLAIGSNVILTPELTMSLDNLGLLSRDSHSYSFDSRANGYARGEGIGVIVIKRLDSAIRDGDTVRAVIRSSSSNQDGKTPGITQPSKDAQVRLIRDTYKKAGLDMALTRYFEAHGTGTPVGDPIETRAIGTAFRRYRSPEEPLYVGSVKSNIGHLEGASGVAGVIKVILALEKGIIPPNSRNLQSLNLQIDEEFLNLKVLQKAIPWPVNGLRRASVSSFGFGGSNCHVVLDDAFNSLRLMGIENGRHQTVAVPPSHADTGLVAQGKRYAINDEVRNLTDDHVIGQKENGSLDKEENYQILVWSTADEEGIKRLVESWKPFLSDKINAAVTSNGGAMLLEIPWGIWEVFQTILCLQSNLPTTLASRSYSLEYDYNKAETAEADRSQQGAQWHAMGRELLHRYRVFADSLAESAKYLKTLGCTWDLLNELEKSASDTNVNNPAYGQPLSTALQVALVDLLDSWGVIPTAVVGHSSGEIAAAYCAGGLTKQSALKASYYRGFLAAKLEELSSMRGSMLAVGLSKKDTQGYIDRIQDPRLVVACINSPRSVTVSGDAEQIDALHDLLQQDEVFSRKLVVNVAYHSVQMREIANEYQSAMGTLEKPSCEKKKAPLMLSSVTGDWVSSLELTDPAYWVRNMVSPVLFSDAVSRICSSPGKQTRKIDGSHRYQMAISHLLEIGPHAALQGPCRDILKSINKQADILYLSLLVRNKSAVMTTLDCAGRLHCYGYPVNLGLVNTTAYDGTNQRRVLSNLPEYPFNHSSSYWHESRKSKGYRCRKFGRLDLVGIPDPDGNPMEATWRNIIRVSEMPWVQDHKINNTILYPAAGMLVMAVEAIKQLVEPDKVIVGFNIKDAVFSSALHIPTHADGIETNIHMKRVREGKSDSSGWYEFRICSYDNNTWIENSTGTIQAAFEAGEMGLNTNGQVEREWQEHLVQSYQHAAHTCAESIDTSVFYEDIFACGYHYGPTFKAITTLRCDGRTNGQFISDVRTYRWADDESSAVAQPHTIHPTTLDAVIHMMAGIVTYGGRKKSVAVPTRIDQAWISSSGLSHPTADSIKVHASSHRSAVGDARYSMTAVDRKKARALLTINGLRVTALESSESRISDSNQLRTENLCHHIEWKPDLNLLNNQEIRAFCASGEPDSEEPVQYFTELDFLVTTYVAKVLKSITDVKTDHPPHMARYVEWMLDQQKALESGRSPFSSEAWRNRMKDESFVNDVHAKLERTNKRGLLVNTVCRNLLMFLKGEIDPIVCLFEGNLLDESYYEMVHSLPRIRPFARYLDALAHQNPHMKILEVGAGSGAMTQFCLQVLCTNSENDTTAPRYGQWDFTDISGSFFAKAQDSFASQGKRMRFKMLDIEQDPGLEGFECGTYDMVVAFLVLHATKDLSASLKNVRKLLKPGGKLVLAEITRPGAIRTTFVFGLFEGWWRGLEPYRQKNPCADSGQWERHLKEAGFSGCDVVIDDYTHEDCQEASLILSTAVHDASTVENSPTISIIIDPANYAQVELGAELEAQLRRVGFANITQTPVEHFLKGEDHTNSLDITLLEGYSPYLYDINEQEFKRLQSLLASTRNLIWVNGGGGHQPCPKYRLVDGLFRVLREENHRTRLTILSLEQKASTKHQAQQIVKLAHSALTQESGIETDYIELDGMLHVGRLIRATLVNHAISAKKLPQRRALRPFGADPRLRLEIGSPGLLNTLHFVEDTSHQKPLGPTEFEVQVKSVGLNFRDVLIALGRLDSEALGAEFAGLVTKVGSSCRKFQLGDRVLACYPSRHANFVRLEENMTVIRIPDTMLSFSEAAALPVAYATAWIALNEIARLQPGEAILIHSGAGGTGQAAIQIAQLLGASIFTTVSSENKKQFLVEKYNIPEDNIFSSRNTLFAKGIKRLTKDKGVDVVLNSLSSEGLIASWESIAPYGRFIEIGKNDILSNSKLPMLRFEQNVTFAAVDLAAMTVDRPHVVTAALETILSLLKEGKISLPDPLQVYGISDIEAAFRQMQSGKNSGKAVLEMRATDEVVTVLATRPEYFFSPEETYLIAGGLGGLGRNIARWFIERGARNLILLSRSGPRNPHAHDLVRELEAKGARVVTPACDITDKEGLKAVLFEFSQTMPPIKGCVQASMVVSDAHFEGISFESWKASTTPKVQGSWNLHELLPRGMNFFVLMSSVAGIYGARGASGYAAGNTFEDGLARYRIALGEKAVSFDLGMFLSVGVLKDNLALREKMLASTVFHQITESDLHALLDIYCNPSLDEIPLLRSQTVVGMTPKLREKGMTTTEWIKRPFYQHMTLVEGTDAGIPGKAEHTNFAALFANAGSAVDVTAAVTEQLKIKLSKMLSLPLAEIDVDKPIHQYGVDSLAAVELRNWFSRELRADVAVFDILGGANIASAVGLAVQKSDYRRAEWGS